MEDAAFLDLSRRRIESFHDGKNEILKGTFFFPFLQPTTRGEGNLITKHNSRDYKLLAQKRKALASPPRFLRHVVRPREFLNSFFCAFQSIDKVFLSLPRRPNQKTVVSQFFLLECRSCFFPRLGWLVHVKLTSNFTAKKKKRKEGG